MGISGILGIQGILVKISTEGNVEWTKLINVDYSPVPGTTSRYLQKVYSSKDSISMAAAEDNEGNLYIAGNYRKDMTFVKKSGEQVVLSPHNTEGWTGDPQSSVGRPVFSKIR